MGSPAINSAIAAVAAALVIAPVASASPDDVVRDCAADGVLNDPHADAEKRAALDRIPADLDEYSDCRSVITASIGRGGGESRGRVHGGDDGDRSGQRVGAAASRGGSRETRRSRDGRRPTRRASGGERLVGELLADAGGTAAGDEAAKAGRGLPFAAWALLATAGLLGLGAARETGTHARLRRGA